jgi:hypothetical protein
MQYHTRQKKKIVKIENKKANCYILTTRICEMSMYGVRSYHSEAGIRDYIRKIEAAQQLFIQVSIKRTAKTCLQTKTLLSLKQIIKCNKTCDMY